MKTIPEILAYLDSLPEEFEKSVNEGMYARAACEFTSAVRVSRFMDVGGQYLSRFDWETVLMVFEKMENAY